MSTLMIRLDLGDAHTEVEAWMMTDDGQRKDLLNLFRRYALTVAATAFLLRVIVLTYSDELHPEDTFEQLMQIVDELA